jgi:hypothetical protein
MWQGKQSISARIYFSGGTAAFNEQSNLDDQGGDYPTSFGGIVKSIKFNNKTSIKGYDLWVQDDN